MPPNGTTETSGVRSSCKPIWRAFIATALFPGLLRSLAPLPPAAPPTLPAQLALTAFALCITENAPCPEPLSEALLIVGLVSTVLAAEARIASCVMGMWICGRLVQRFGAAPSRRMSRNLAGGRKGTLRESGF
ncbi:hypothetical protein AcW1_001651 [Taiwanofungus camphoratus]|nr:hypothetical protein AcV7_001508 [Antrodia cinnamomea]KAI0945423.1 hypothetical protein AcW1_001651 [Antrodia cinnamomea]